jgi:hypothetical protein
MFAPRLTAFLDSAGTLPVFPGSRFDTLCSRTMGYAVYFIAADAATLTPARDQAISRRVHAFLRGAGFNALDIANNENQPYDPDTEYSYYLTNRSGRLIRARYASRQALERSYCANLRFGTFLEFAFEF